MKTTPTCITLAFLITASLTGPTLQSAEKTRIELPKARLIVLADMGNEPDEEQQMMHMLMCHNAFDLEGLIAVSGIHIHPEKRNAYRRVVHPERFLHLIDAYEQAYHNLHVHADGWLSPFNLRMLVVKGQPEYGVAGTGPGKSSEGSELIIRQVSNDDPRPVFIVVNAGSNTLAQALIDYRETHTPEELAAFVAKIRVFENGAQDDAGAWIAHHFPDIHWIRGMAQSKSYGGPKHDQIGPHVWKPYPYSTKGQDEWAHEHVRTGHGDFGKVYPMRLYFTRTFENPAFIEGGGTVPWLGLVPHGLTNPSEQSWGGWSGRYTVEKVANVRTSYSEILEQEENYLPWAVYTDAVDRWVDPDTGEVHHDEYAAIWHWRQAFWNDFRARMDWCVKPYNEANHHPVAALDGDTTNAIIMMSSKIGDQLSFDASASTDPDGDSLHYKWWNYPEAGTRPYGKELPLEGAERARASFTIPDDAKGKQLHLILEVWDDSKIVNLVDYRRVVIDVN